MIIAGFMLAFLVWLITDGPRQAKKADRKYEFQEILEEIGASIDQENIVYRPPAQRCIVDIGNMEEIKGFFILGINKEKGHPIKAIRKGLAEYDDVPDNAVIFWSGNLSTLTMDYRVSWLESGEQVGPMYGAQSMMLNDFIADYGSTSKAAP